MTNPAFIIEDNIPMPAHSPHGREASEFTKALESMTAGQCLTCPLPDGESTVERRRTVGRYRSRMRGVMVKHPSRQYHQRTVCAEVGDRMVDAVRIWRTS